MNELLFDPETHRKAGRLLGEFLANYEVDLVNRPVFPNVNRDAMRAILAEPLPEEGRSILIFINRKGVHNVRQAHF